MNAAALDVGHVHLDVREGQRAQAVAQRVAGEQERRRVHHHAVDLLFHPAVEPLDRRRLAVGVEDVEPVLVRLRVRAQHRVELGRRRLAVELRLALAEVAHVGPLDEQDIRHRAVYVLVKGTKSYSPMPCSTRNVAELSPPLVTRCGRRGATV